MWLLLGRLTSPAPLATTTVEDHLAPVDYLWTRNCSNSRRMAMECLTKSAPEHDIRS